MAVGHGGRRLSSKDGLHWEHDQRFAADADAEDAVLLDVASGAGRFVAVGGGATGGRILSTTDGKTWSEHPRLASRVATVVYGNGRFAAFRGGELLHSADGAQFQAGETLPWAGEIHPRKCAFGDTEAGSMMVIIGEIDRGSGEPRLHWRASTHDGQRYAAHALDTKAAAAIAYGAGHFVVVGPAGTIELSHDGRTWEKQAAPADEDFRAVLWNGTYFVAQGRKVWASTDGRTWLEKQTPSIPGTLAWGEKSFGWLAVSWERSLVFSSDLQHWRDLGLPAGPPLTAIASDRP